MKKFSLILAIALAATLFAAPAGAEDGAGIGKIYSTDILALVNNVPIESYSIGGKTAILAEDLGRWYYGLSVEYNEADRLLVIFSSVGTPYRSDPVKRGKTGAILGNVYESGVTVIFNGHETKGYDIGGKIAVCIEDLGAPDDSPNSRYGYSKYLSNFVWDENQRTIALNTVMSNALDVIWGTSLPCFEYSLTDDVLTARYDPMNIYYSSLSQSVSSEEFLADPFTLKPLYLETGGERHEIGLCYVSRAPEYDHTILRLTDVEATKKLLMASIPPRKTYDEALEYLYNLPGYTVTERLDNEDYTVLSLFADDPAEGWFLCAAVKKTGGYLKIHEEPSPSPDWETIWGITPKAAAELEGNKGKISLYPFTGPHGDIATLITYHDLDEMQF